MKSDLKKSRQSVTQDQFGAIGVSHTAVDKDGAWDAGANLKRLGDSPSKASLRAMHAWVDADKDAETKAAYKLPHHNVSGDGKVGAANMKAVESAMGRLNGGGLDIPEGDRKGVHAHLAAHYKDAGMDAPELKAAAEAPDAITQFLTILTGDPERAKQAKEQLLSGNFLSAARSTVQEHVQYFGPDEEGDPDDKDEDDPEAQFVPSTANDKDGTIDCVWYGGATVPRMDQQTGDPYMLNLAMEGCRMDRLNAGGPIFDTHFSGDDFKSIVSGMFTGKVGTRAQVGVVRKAWAEGKTGRATLQFDLGNPDGAELYRKVKAGIVQNLSFGAWIYKREKTEASASPEGAAPYSDPNEIGMFTATDWEPFEISPVTVPADFTTQFLSAQPIVPKEVKKEVQPPPKEEITGATAQEKEHPRMEPTTQGAGNEARLPEEQLAAARAEAKTQEQSRISDIRKLVKLSSLDEKFADELITANKPIDEVRKDIFAKMEANGQQDANGKKFPIQGEVSITRDKRDTMREQMEAALLMRHSTRFYSDWAKSYDPSHERAAFLGSDKERYDALVAAQRELVIKGREFIGMSLLDMAKECLTAAGIDVRRLHKSKIAEISLHAPITEVFDPMGIVTQYFAGGAESTSDFPSIVANVANKTLRQGYEAYPRTFQPFSKQVTAQDFKPINRVQLSDSPVLAPLNEKGEYTRANLTDSNQNYSLATFGKIVALTRKVIINDDLQAFTRVPAALGVAAARLESDKVWAVLTGNQVMGEDGVACFNSAHTNYNTGANSALSLGAANPPTGMTYGRSQMRRQTGPQGTPLNLIPRFAAVPTVLETVLLQMIAPLNIASTDVTKVVPEWVRSIVPIVEPRLDNNSTTGWYLIADPAEIDTVEYCYLEGQQGVYIETRQGFEVDGIEIKARMDFAAAAIDYRGLQFNAGV